MEAKGKRITEVENLGMIDYKTAWDYQEKLFASLVENKIANRNLTDEDKIEPLHHLLICEHNPVFTLGRNGDIKNLLIDERTLEEKNISFYKINRGGDITFHGPGQFVGYPILDLDYFFTDIGKYLRLLEESVILTLADYGISAGRSEGETGVWLEPNSPSRARKICAIGVKCSRWITMHGFAFNINTDLDYFNFIVPCGIQNKGVTSLQKELKKEINLHEVQQKWLTHFSQLFDVELIYRNNHSSKILHEK